MVPNLYLQRQQSSTRHCYSNRLQNPKYLLNEKENAPSIALPLSQKLVPSPTSRNGRDQASFLEDYLSILARRGICEMWDVVS
jgi:hypothetical protein